ncbi:MAG: NAD(P)H-dependent oxidoreductase [Xanthobacteraceae bacterium]|nr:NAD(P)H-dependent oxidoreductase [Xanthobacteraceae bacterium]
MRILIVHAHHEPTSFNSAMTRQAMEVLAAAGHEVVVSDLYAMGFDPVSDRRNFTTVADSGRLRQQDEEALASASGGFVPELQAEMDKVDWCDVMIFQFPIWWLSLPAILKGWVDRVFAVGRAYGGGRFFDSGRFVGKRAMCSLTVGGPAEVYSDVGVYVSIDQILFPIHRGVFAFTGFTVIEPFVVYGPNRIAEDERRTYLTRYRQRLLSLDTAPVLTSPIGADFQRLVPKAGSRG